MDPTGTQSSGPHTVRTRRGAGEVHDSASERGVSSISERGVGSWARHNSSTGSLSHQRKVRKLMHGNRLQIRADTAKGDCCFGCSATRRGSLRGCPCRRWSVHWSRQTNKRQNISTGCSGAYGAIERGNSLRRAGPRSAMLTQAHAGDVIPRWCMEG